LPVNPAYILTNWMQLCLSYISHCFEMGWAKRT